MTPRFIGAVMFEVIATAAAPAQVLDGAGIVTPRASYAALTAASEGWFYDATATGGTLWIKVSAPTTVSVQ